MKINNPTEEEKLHFNLKIGSKNRKSDYFFFLFFYICCRFINPVVVAPTVAAVGLAFFSYGFPQAGACVEISIPEIFLVLVFTLVSMFSSMCEYNLVMPGI